MDSNQAGNSATLPMGSAPMPGPNDLPPPYSSVVGNPQYGFVPPGGPFPPPKQFTPTGVYPHPVGPTVVVNALSDSDASTQPGMPIGIVMPMPVGSEPTTVTCFNCGKVVTTRVNFTTAWHTHLVAGSICVITMVCSLCCLGLVPYCFDSFKEAEHYCPNCNTFIGKSNKC